MSFLCLVFIITSNRWYRCLWFKKKCSEHSDCGTHTTQHFVFGSISSGLHGHQVENKNPILLVLYSAVKKCTNSQMEKCYSKEGHRDPSCSGFGSIYLWFSLLCLLLSVGFFLWLDITFVHDSVWKEKKKEFVWKLSQKNEWSACYSPSLPRSVIKNIIGLQWIMCPFLTQSLARRKTRLPVVQLGLSKVLTVELAHPWEHGLYGR